MPTFLGSVLAMSVTMVLIPLLMRWSTVLGFQDLPGARKVHITSVPRVGGIAMVGGVLLALGFWGEASRQMHALWAGIAVLAAFGVWDDRKALRSTPKFAGQAIAVLIVMVWGGVSISALTAFERLPLPVWIAMPLAFTFLVGCTNAFNLADGLDGLAGGMAILCLSVTALLAYTVGNAAVGAGALFLVGALLGFLRFNTHPARVFMGDTGSQMLGFCAAVLTLLLTQAPGTPLSTALPLLLLGVPIIDTLMVMTERLLAGRSPFVADRNHLHHRLLALGFGHRQAVGILYLMQGCLFVAAWLLRYASDLAVALCFVAFSAVAIGSIRLAQHLGWQRRHRPDRARRFPGASTAPVGTVLAAALAAYAAWILFSGSRPLSDERWLAWLLAAILIGGLLLRWRRSDAGWLDRLALYATAALAIFLSKRGAQEQAQLVSGALPSLQITEWILYPLLAVSMIVCVRSSGERRFQVTPLDLLVLLTVVALPNLPDSIVSYRGLGLTLAELALLFYSLEALSLVMAHRWRWLSGAAALFLIGLALRTGF
jgi:UDP-GlcNAc:undecaprenyl-phosphate GlcNAc-1-phosphate transferase